MKIFFKIPTSILCVISLVESLYGAMPQQKLLERDIQDMQKSVARKTWQNPKKPVAELVDQAMFSQINIIFEFESDAVDVDATIAQAFRELEDIVKKYDAAGYSFFKQFKPQQAQTLLNPHAQFALYRKLASIGKFIEQHRVSQDYPQWKNTFDKKIDHIDKAIKDLQPKLRYWQLKKQKKH